MRVLAPVLLIAATILSYLPAFQNGFVYDDHYQLERNPYVRSFEHLKILFTKEVWYFSPRTKSNNYRPVHMLTYLVIYKLFGLNPIAYHAAYLLLYLASVLVLWKIYGHYVAALPAFLGGLLFATHPVHVESVGWIGGADLLCGLFLFIALLLYLYQKNVLSLLSFAFALLSKETALTFPLIIVVDYLLFRKRDKWRVISWCGGASVLMVAYAGARIYALGSFMRMNESTADPLSIAHTGIAFAGLYLSKMLFPLNLTAVYHFTLPLSLKISWPGFVLLFCALILLYVFRKNKNFVFGCVWYGALILPALFSRGVSPSLFSERYLYLPSAGFFLAAVSFPLTGYVPHLLIAVSLLFGGMTYVRCKTWHDDLTLWTDTVGKSPLSPTANYNLATAYARQKDYQRAAHYYEQAAILNPERAEPYYDLAVCQHFLGQDDRAAQSLRMFLRYSKSDDPLRKDAEQKLKQLSTKEGK